MPKCCFLCKIYSYHLFATFQHILSRRLLAQLLLQLLDLGRHIVLGLCQLASHQLLVLRPTPVNRPASELVVLPEDLIQLWGKYL